MTILYELTNQILRISLQIKRVSYSYDRYTCLKFLSLLQVNAQFPKSLVIPVLPIIEFSGHS